MWVATAVARMRKIFYLSTKVVRTFMKSEAPSAWSMVGMLAVSVYMTLRHMTLRRPSIPALLITLSAAIHVPHSFRYHINYKRNDRRRLFYQDVKYMFVGHAILHSALSYNIPLCIACFTAPMYYFITSDILRNIPYTSMQELQKKYAISRSWIFLLHYIPIYITTGSYTYVLGHFGLFSFMLGVYLALNNPLGNFLMHCGLILNTVFAHLLVAHFI